MVRTNSTSHASGATDFLLCLDSFFWFMTSALCPHSPGIVIELPRVYELEIYMFEGPPSFFKAAPGRFP